VLLSNCDANAPGVVNLGDLSGPLGENLASTASQPSAKRKACFAQRGLLIFSESGAPLLEFVSRQSPDALGALSSTSCRWHPARVFRTILESLASTPDLEKEVRGALFRTTSAAMKAFSWQCRCQLYLEIINASHVDAIIGAVVTLFKDDWWPRVVSQASLSDGNLSAERKQLVQVLSCTLAGEVQIIDGMDTLTAALNIARLVALAKTPAAAFLREALRRDAAGCIDLEAKLLNISKQIDAELSILGHNESTGGDALAEAMSEALGQDKVNLTEMKRDRITMVAHLVSRVREVLSETTK